MADPSDLPDWAAGNAPAAASAPAGEDTSLPDWVNEAKAPAEAPAAHHAAPPARHAPPPQHAAAPSAPAKPAPEASWGETFQQAGQNFAPSLIGAGQAMLHAATHPLQTGKNIFQLGAGLGSQAAGALGVQQDAQKKAQTEALAKALESHYAQAYGSVKGFKQALASDPVSVMTDAASVLGGGEAALGKVAGLEQAASVAGKLGSAIDPVANAVRVAKVVAKPAVSIARKASSVGTGVPSSLLDVAAAAGKTSDPALRGAFTKFYSGQGDPSEFLTTAQNALGAMKQEQSQAYLAKKATLANAQPSFQPIDDALAAARQKTMVGGVRGPQFQAANDALDQAENIVNHWKQNAQNPEFGGLNGFDNLKQSIWDLRDGVGNNVAKDQLGGVYNGVKKAITDVDPEYAKLMEQYQLGLNAVKDTQRTLVGAGSNPAATAAMAKTLRALKTPSGQNLFADLAKHEPTLPYMMAGHELSPWVAKGKAGLLEGLGIPMAGLTALHNPIAGAGQLLGQTMLQSPKIAGAMSYATGMADRFPTSALARADYYAGKLDQQSPEDVAAGPNPALPETAPALSAIEQKAEQPLNDAVWTAMLSRESHGQQFDKSGNTITSPKGALGISQMMPGTGPQAARIAGEEWDPQRLRTDPEYNQRLGHAYYAMLLDMFGDPVKAAAAYNAGPRAVQNAIMLAAERHDDWTAHLPVETQGYVEYVTRHTGRPARASGGRIGKDHEHLVQRLMNRAKSCRKEVNKTTEPLLNESDHVIGHALAVANKAI